MRHPVEQQAAEAEAEAEEQEEAESFLFSQIK